MIQSRGVKLVPLTRDLASQFASMERWSGERPLKPRRVSELKNKIERGLFHSPEWAVAFLNGKQYRMNGQHSSHALVESNGSFPNNLVVKIEEFSVDSENELGELFAQFDTGGRSSNDITGAGTILLKDIPIRARTALASGMFYALSDFSKNGTAEQRVSAIHSDHEFARWAASNMTAPHIARVPVFAAAFMMWRANQSACREFWRLVASEEYPAPFHATRTVARELRDLRSKRKSTSAAKEVCGRCVSGWNAWREGREVRYTKYYGALPQCSR